MFFIILFVTVTSEMYSIFMNLNNNKVKFTSFIQNLTHFYCRKMFLKNIKFSHDASDASKQYFNGENPKNVFEEASKRFNKRKIVFFF